MEEQEIQVLGPTADTATRTITPSLDCAKYRLYLAPLELTPEQEDQFMSTLWSMMTVFVDQAFGLDPVQAACAIVEKSSLPSGEFSVQQDKHDHVQGPFSQASAEPTVKEKPS